VIELNTPKKKKKKTSPEESPFLYTENVAMNTEYTGMMQRPADKEHERESYSEMLDD
jgi:hypothetical protein